MSYLRRSALLALTAAVCVFCCAAEPPAKPTKEQIAKWIQQLGDDDFSTREEASKKLYEAGQPAEEAVQEAAHSDDAEVARRADEILDKFKWGLYPDAPKKVVDLVTRYRAADANGKQAVIRELLDAGPSGYRTLLKIAGAEPDLSVRSQVFGVIAAEVSRVAPQLLIDENYDTLQLLLDVMVANDAEQGVSHYAVYWAMRGKLDERIAHFKALAAKGVDAPRNWEILAELYHAKGDLTAAREAADKADKPELGDAILFEAGDWKALAARPIHGSSNLPYESLGYLATYRRLSGDAKGFADSVADLHKMADAAPADEYQRFHIAKVLFLNDRPDEAIALLTATPGRQAAAFEALAAQMKYKEAIALADAAKTANAQEAPLLEILKARVLYQLGEKDKATAIFDRYGDQIGGAAKVSWAETLIEAENRVGLKEKAFKHAAYYLCPGGDEATPARVFAKLFPKGADVAESLWAMLLEQHNATPETTMRYLRGLLDGTADPKTVADLAQRVRTGLQNLRADEVDKRQRAVAEAALAAKDEEQARSLLEKAGSAEALIRLGDLDADKKEWDKAAKQYHLAWEKDHTQPLALFLEGNALVQSGKDKEGKKLMDLAHWTPLGDGEARMRFLHSLLDRGQTAAVKREGELLRLCAAGSPYAAEGLRQVALEALERKDYLAAAAGQEQYTLRCLNRVIGYPQATAYLGAPTFLHRLRAEGCTAAGKFDEARKEAAQGLAILPGDTFIPIELIPAWEKAGHKKEAAELFDQCLAVQNKVCTDYPDCPWAHNSVAWVSACCRRNLESAQEHALKAVALAPNSAGNLDTLAEVYFQRGDKDKAVATEKKVIEMDPKKPYFRKQLKRIEAGDPAADRPSEADDSDE